MDAEYMFIHGLFGTGECRVESAGITGECFFLDVAERLMLSFHSLTGTLATAVVGWGRCVFVIVHGFQAEIMRQRNCRTQSLRIFCFNLCVRFWVSIERN